MGFPASHLSSSAAHHSPAARSSAAATSRTIQRGSGWRPGLSPHPSLLLPVYVSADDMLHFVVLSLTSLASIASIAVHIKCARLACRLSSRQGRKTCWLARTETVTVIFLAALLIGLYIRSGQHPRVGLAAIFLRCFHNHRGPRLGSRTGRRDFKPDHRSHRGRDSRNNRASRRESSDRLFGLPLRPDRNVCRVTITCLC
jgi:hypothetical protein